MLSVRVTGLLQRSNWGKLQNWIIISKWRTNYVPSSPYQRLTKTIYILLLQTYFALKNVKFVKTASSHANFSKRSVIDMWQNFRKTAPWIIWPITFDLVPDAVWPCRPTSLLLWGPPPLSACHLAPFTRRLSSRSDLAPCAFRHLSPHLSSPSHAPSCRPTSGPAASSGWTRQRSAALALDGWCFAECARALQPIGFKYRGSCPGWVFCKVRIPISDEANDSFFNSADTLGDLFWDKWIPHS